MQNSPSYNLYKFHIYTLKLDTIFWHCKTNSEYFWTRVYVHIRVLYVGSICCLMGRFLQNGMWQMLLCCACLHYSDVMMDAMASQITSPTIVYSTVYSGADQRKYQSFASLPFVRGIQRWPVNSSHKGPVKRKMFPFDDVIMVYVCIPCLTLVWQTYYHSLSKISDCVFLFCFSLGWYNWCPFECFTLAYIYSSSAKCITFTKRLRCYKVEVVFDGVRSAGFCWTDSCLADKFRPGIIGPESMTIGCERTTNGSLDWRSRGPVRSFNRHGSVMDIQGGLQKHGTLCWDYQGTPQNYDEVYHNLIIVSIPYQDCFSIIVDCVISKKGASAVVWLTNDSLQFKTSLAMERSRWLMTHCA